MADAAHGADAIEDVLDLLAEFRETRGVGGRARVAVQLTQALRRLEPAQRRQLAVDVAQRAAPHLVERIEQDADVDLSPAQLRAVIEMVGNMDRDDVEGLRSSVRDPEWQRRAAARVLGSADEVLADAGVELGDVNLSETLPPPSAGDVEQALDTDDGLALGNRDGQHDLDGQAAADAAEMEPTSAAPSPAEDSTVAIAPVEPPDGPRSPPEPQVQPTPVSEYRTGLPEMTAWRASGADSDLFSFPPLQTPEERRHASPSSPTPPSVEQSWFTAAELDVERVAVPRTDLGERLRAAERPIEQLRVLRAALAEFVALSPREQASVLGHLQATWIRRRAVLALIADGHVTESNARAVVGCFDSAVNRAWIVASLVEAGVAPVSAFADLLTPAAAARLERRYVA
ncbi:MAG: hypothetical protein R3249_00390 [Nitriliruptorales bacterium]|nr:hypothetical protein [Nitriliruptorales bacterium]